MSCFVFFEPQNKQMSSKSVCTPCQVLAKSLTSPRQVLANFLAQHPPVIKLQPKEPQALDKAVQLGGDALVS